MTAVPWVHARNVLAFPHGWQRPAKTEEWAYERCVAELGENRFAQMVCFPWATLIDLLRKGKHARAQCYLTALRWAEPRKTLVRATICQHIHAKDMLPYFKHLKITDLFWSHAVNSEREMEGIRIHPFPLYPVRYFEKAQPAEAVAKPVWERDYLYSFVGAHDPGLYLRQTRQWIFDLPKRETAYVERKGEWHYENSVYGEQIEGVPSTPRQQQEHDAANRRYENVLQNTVFSLCPSGAGPNSIRLWESLGFGCIPVVLADDFRPAAHPELWQEAVVQVKEAREDVARLPQLLSDLYSNRDQLNRMAEAGRQLWTGSIERAYLPEINQTIATMVRGRPRHGFVN